MIRVMLADDHTLVREGLKQLLSAAPGINVAGEAGDGDAALALVRAEDFDVAVLDLSMPGLSGIDLIKRVLREKPKLRVLVLSMHGEQQYAVRALKAGASGYLTKDSAPSQLVSVIRKIAAGGVHVSETAAALLIGRQAATTDAPHTRLSDREFEIFRALVGGEAVGSLADRLNLSVKTVSTHKARILQKMNMESTAELVRYAVERKLL
ncbi:MAG: DNA-binding response regulator [Betaproteobacteria bacterium RIFCSPLOWO2_02_FULL_66_14]|nr:MAG: DNA-binding response regulator [Betaproteobacteria bacterium RIFCSPLOWO2_02_FULL_66_14]